MKYKKLGNTDLDVSLICLGTMTWGQQNTEEEGHEQMDYAVDRGVNFFDTAELYSIPPKAEHKEVPKQLLELGLRKTRIETKLFWPQKLLAEVVWIGLEEERLDSIKKYRGCDRRELKRLQTDYVDLYQLHWPDRPLPMFGGEQVFTNIMIWRASQFPKHWKF